MTRKRLTEEQKASKARDLLIQRERKRLEAAARRCGELYARALEDAERSNVTEVARKKLLRRYAGLDFWALQSAEDLIRELRLEERPRYKRKRTTTALKAAAERLLTEQSTCQLG